MLLTPRDGVLRPGLPRKLYLLCILRVSFSGDGQPNCPCLGQPCGGPEDLRMLLGLPKLLNLSPWEWRLTASALAHVQFFLLLETFDRNQTKAVDFL